MPSNPYTTNIARIAVTRSNPTHAAAISGVAAASTPAAPASDPITL